VTVEQAITLATPIAVIVAAVIQKLDSLRAERDRCNASKKIDVVHDLVNDKFTKLAEKLAAALEHTADKSPDDPIAAERAKAARKDVMDLQQGGPPTHKP
jgi:Zn-dependent M32 family carboxypeptidase